jgi:hypothetical protein
VLLFSMLPINSIAAKKDTGNVFLYVRNRTGGNVHIVLTNAAGKKTVFDYPVGMAKETLPQGPYSYYIITPCQKLTGGINLNVTKQLFFTCNQGVDLESFATWSVQPALWTPPFVTPLVPVVGDSSAGCTSSAQCTDPFYPDCDTQTGLCMAQ